MIRCILDHLEKFIPIARQFALPDAADPAQFVQAGGALVEDFQQGAVVEDDVSRYALFAREFRAFGFEGEPQAVFVRAGKRLARFGIAFGAARPSPLPGRGAGPLTDVLTGKLTERVEKFNHQQLSTFGIGKELSPAQWSGVYRQLVASGLLEADIEAYGGLKLSEAARPVLRGEQEVWLRRDADPAKRKAQRAERNAKSREPFAGANEDRLWLALKAKRTELAREQGVPPYVIFHDSTLLEILNQRPATLTELGRISGVGQNKLARYGDEFLRVLEDEANREER